MYYYDPDKVKLKIKRAMISTGINQPALSVITGIPQSRISKCLKLNAKEQFTLEQIVSVANALNLSLDEIVSNDKVQEHRDCRIITLSDFAQSVHEFVGRTCAYIDTEYDVEGTKEPFNHQIVFTVSATPEMCKFADFYSAVSIAARMAQNVDILTPWLQGYIDENKCLDITGEFYDEVAFKIKYDSSKKMKDTK